MVGWIADETPTFGPRAVTSASWIDLVPLRDSYKVPRTQTDFPKAGLRWGDDEIDGRPLGCELNFSVNVGLVLGWLDG